MHGGAPAVGIFPPVHPPAIASRSREQARASEARGAGRYGESFTAAIEAASSDSFS